MHFLEKAPLQRKITWVTMMTALATVIIALFALSIVESWEFRRSFEQELRSIAGVTGRNSIAALEFLDTDAAEKILSVLQEDPRILGAWIYDANDHEFASYVSETAAHSKSLQGVQVTLPIIHKQQQLGSILIVASDRELTERLAEYSSVSVFVLLLSSLAAYLLSHRLRSIISAPILQLAETAREVSGSGDVSLRVAKETEDETGELVVQFNSMLDTIQRTSTNLRERENQLRTITDSLPVLIAYIDKDERYQFNNAAYRTWFDWDPARIKGMKLREFIGPEAYARVQPYIARAFSGESVSYEQELNYTKIGRRIIAASLIPDMRDGTNVLGVFALMIDHTDRKDAETERERLLQNERAARGEAERANILKDEFLTTLSHELRTPLNAIVGWSQILLKTNPVEPQVAEGLSVIFRNARVQAKLIADLLDLSRIISGKLILDMKKLQLRDVIDAALDAVTVSARSKNLTLQFETEPNLQPVLGDGSRLQQVVWNLLSNSIKFTPNGGTVTVTLRQPETGWVQIRVSDTGQGISADFLPYVFQRFRQADASTTRKFGGLGIGLALVKQIVEHHGGRVYAESPGSGLGSTFIVELPTSIGATDSDSVTEVGGPDLSGVRVLVIDDEPDALRLVKHMLEESRATVILADNANKGLELLRTSRPHIVLSDIGMPEHSGYDLINWIRALDPKDGGWTPAVALTALARPEDRERALAAGFQAHIAKPIEDMELVRIVSQLVTAENRSAA